MKLRIYRLSDQAAKLQPATTAPPAGQANATLDGTTASESATPSGWVALCPVAFTATWNGGPRAEDIEIHLEGVDAASAAAPAGPAFVQSNLGEGLLTFYPGYQFKTEAEDVLWLCGPVDAPKDGLAPLDQIVDTSLLPCTVTMQWQFTRPHHPIRFEAGEPFATLLVYPKAALENVHIEVIEHEDNAEVYAQAFQQMADTPALTALFQRLGAAPVEPIPQTATPAGAPQRVSGAWAAKLTNPPPVSCLCPTYGRVELLEEAIYAFLQQDYPGQKELIVLNDYDQQTLVFDHPEVRIINLPRRFHSVGEKYKAAVALAMYDLLFVWHDDDIYLPHRLSFSVAQCDQGKTFFKANSAWFWNDGKLSGPEQNIFHGGSCWQRDLFRQTHGYPHLGPQYDLEFERLCAAQAPDAMVVATVKPEEIYYIYRWKGTNSYHLSAMGADEQASQKVVTYIAQQAARGLIPQGEVRLQPHWNSDYGTLVQAQLATTPAVKKDKIWGQVEEIPFPPPFHVIPPPPPLPAAQAAQLFQGDYPAKISVILPASNESVLLQRTVEQFVATLPANSEVIVVDNGSTDGCADFLLARPIENVQLIRTPDQLGVAGARNRGLAQAQGEIVVFADAHLDLPEDWWQPIACTLQRPEVGIVGPGIGVMGNPKLPISCGQRIAEAKLRVQWLPWQGVEPYPVPTLGGGFMAMRHATLKRAGAFDAGMPQWGSEDLEICVRYWLLGYEVWVAPAVTVLHYFRKANPYKVEWGAVTHNLLRVALLHFNQARLTRVVNALKGNNNFAQAMAYAVESDVWQKRAEFAAQRVHDDDWYFEKFKDSCEV